MIKAEVVEGEAEAKSPGSGYDRSSGSGSSYGRSGRRSLKIQALGEIHNIQLIFESWA
jgi:hypothetical protein